MKILNELVDLANKANAAGQGTPEMVEFRVVANPDNTLAIAEAFRALEKRAEAAEAKLSTAERAIDNLDCERGALKLKLAELEKQESVPTKLKYSSVLPKFIGDTDEVESYHCMIHGNTRERKSMEEAYADAKQMCGDLFTRAAPAINLAALVPDEMSWVRARQLFNPNTCDDDVFTAFMSGANHNRAAILRKIEEAE